MAFDCKIKERCSFGQIGFKEKKTTEAVKNKILEINHDIRHSEKFVNWQYLEFGKIRELTKLPQQNEAFRILCNRNINAAEILNVFTSIDEISCSFATINKTGLDIINKFKVKNLFARIHPVNENEYFAPLFEQLIAEKKYKITGHLKIFLIKSNEEFYTVITSANPKTSSQFECYTIYNSEKYYNYCLGALQIIATAKNKEKTKIELSKSSFTTINKGGLTMLDIIKKINSTEQIEQIDFVVYSLGIKAIEELSYLESKIKINFYLSDFVLKMSSQVKPLEAIKKMILKHNGKIKIYNNHTKITLIKTNQSYYVIDTTSNFGSNSKYEITELRNSEKEYNFTQEFIKKHFK